MKRLLAALAVTLALLPAAPASAHDKPTPIEIQYSLRSVGYSLAVDGVYGSVTRRAVVHYQRANGLYPDGIVGPITWAAMTATATVPAVRLEPPVAVVTAIGTPGNCESYRPAVERAGMPWSFFGPVMYRESRCDPQAYNGRNRDRSYGLFQLNTYGTLWGYVQTLCGVTAREQLFDPQTNIDCAAAMYRQRGTDPWKNVVTVFQFLGWYGLATLISIFVLAAIAQWTRWEPNVLASAFVIMLVIVATFTLVAIF